MVAWVLCAVAMIAYILPMNQISRIFFVGQGYEGDFRYTHSRGIANAESVAFYRGEPREHAHAKRRFRKLYFNWIRYYLWQGFVVVVVVVVVVVRLCFFSRYSITSVFRNFFLDARKSVIYLADNTF